MLMLLKGFFKNQHKHAELDIRNSDIDDKEASSEKHHRRFGKCDPLVEDNVVERDKYERVILLTDLLTESGLTPQELDTLSQYFETKAVLG